MIDLPTSPKPAAAMPFLVDKGGILPGGLGAPDQRVNRLGNRFGIAVTMPVMKSAILGRQWVAALIRAQTEGARMAFPQPRFVPGTTGTIRVNGASQAGTTLIVDGATASYAFKAGQFFSVLTSGVHAVYMVTTDTNANGSGQASLPIAPMLRVSPADNDICNFATPLIEGFVTGDERQWNLAVGGFTSVEFEIRERR